MKATTIIIASVLALQVNILLAGNEATLGPVTNETATITLASLAPSTPTEVTFEEVVEMNEFANLAPMIPSEATFEDMPSEIASIVDLAPMTPTVAEFEDAVDMITVNVIDLAFVTPDEADFE